MQTGRKFVRRLSKYENYVNKNGGLNNTRNYGFNYSCEVYIDCIEVKTSSFVIEKT
jgi:hypothetical protein